MVVVFVFFQMGVECFPVISWGEDKESTWQYKLAASTRQGSVVFRKKLIVCSFDIFDIGLICSLASRVFVFCVYTVLSKLKTYCHRPQALMDYL